MLHSRSVNNKINRLHERALRIVLSVFKLSFESFLEKHETISIHVKNLQALATEMYNISENFSVSLMSQLFYQNVNHYALRNPYEFSIPNVNSVFHEQENILYLGPLIWQLLPSELKDSNNARVIRKWKLNNCP